MNYSSVPFFNVLHFLYFWLSFQCSKHVKGQKKTVNGEETCLDVMKLIVITTAAQMTTQ